LVAVGAAATAALGLASVELGTSASPFSGRWADLTPPRPGPAVLLPVLVAAVVLLASWSLTARPTGLRWPGLLLLSYLGSLCWTLSLAVAAPGSLDDALGAARDLLAAVGAVGAADDSPTAYLDGLTGPELLPVAAEAGHHPPGPVLLLWSLTRL
nr:hypothetical protein [Micromonospora sp. DSM 115978]